MKYQNNIDNEFYNNTYCNNFNFQEDEFSYEQPNELFMNNGGSNNILRAVAHEETPMDFFANYINSNCIDLDNIDFSSSNNHEDASMICEDETTNKVQKHSYANNSTSEADSQSSEQSSKKSYEHLFTMVDDKKLYIIGSEEDSLTLTNNSELICIDKIISNDTTDMNNFIGDMLKSCPCDMTDKSNRIYKANNIKRKRKTKVQIRQLEKELIKSSIWEKEDFKRLSVTLGLTRDQVYKWFWDQKRKSQ